MNDLPQPDCNNIGFVRGIHGLQRDGGFGSRGLSLGEMLTCVKLSVERRFNVVNKNWRVQIGDEIYNSMTARL